MPSRGNFFTWPGRAHLYHELDSEPDIEKDKNSDPTLKKQKPRYLTPLVIAGAITACLVLWTVLLFDRGTSQPSQSSRCQQPAIRREWRSLDPTEQTSYISVVNCLRTHPSRLGRNHTLYDDFPWVHSQIGEYSHESAAFLAWHRYFIHTYENALRETCGYTGHLTYWDWTLDWQDVTKAPVWGPDAFGSSGEAGVGEEILQGHCVTDGPFAKLEVGYLKNEWHPHCLTRGFAKGEELSNLSSWIRPSAIESLLADDDYEAFNLGLERAAHLAIPRSVRGDFLLFTAPADPVFFLHHTQLDRLWSKWQSQEGRAFKYVGSAAHSSQEQASLTDLIPMGGLAPDVRVQDIISTQAGELCYNY